MGIRPRIFLVPEDDSIRHLPLARYVRLLRQDPNERLPEYAGKHIRYALASVDEISWTPVQIERIQYSYLSFDSSGKLDLTERTNNIQWVSDLSTMSQKEGACHQVVDARRRFAQKRFEIKYKWTPTPKITKCIFLSIFGEQRGEPDRFNETEVTKYPKKVSYIKNQ